MCVYDKTYYPYANQDKFIKVCAEVESKVPNLMKDRLLQDVDGSNIQSYNYNGKAITIFDDYEVDAIYLESEIDLTEYLEKD